MKIETMYEKSADKSCRLCAKFIYPGDLPDCVGIQTKRKDYLLFHRNCIAKESGCNKNLTFTEVVFR